MGPVKLKGGTGLGDSSMLLGNLVTEANSLQGKITF